LKNLNVTQVTSQAGELSCKASDNNYVQIALHLQDVKKQ